MTEAMKGFIQKNEKEKIIEIEIERLRSFKNHPFQVKDDNEMHLLKESIEKYGILTPLIVRPVPDGVYEIIAGHRRRHAAELLGYRKVPVIIRVMNEDEAILNMVDSNLHREKISFSEKAFAYKMKNDVLKRKSGRKKGQIDHKTKKKRTVEIISEECGDTITMPEMARLLGITRSQVYGILKNSKYSHFFETIVIAEKKRITKESFQKFLDGQDHYKLDPANDYEELSMEQNFSLANYRRKKLAKTGDRSKNGNLGYLTFDEAAFLAKVSRGMIYKWIDDGKFSSVKIGYISRVKRDEFEAWLKERERKGN